MPYTNFVSAILFFALMGVSGGVLPGVEVGPAPPLRTRDDVAVYVQNVLELMVSNEATASGAAFAKVTDIPPESVDKMWVAIGQSRAEMVKNFGRSLGIIKIASLNYSEYVGKDLYLERLERNGLVWIFTSYKTGDGTWTVLSLKSDKVDNLWQHLGTPNK